MGQTLTLAGPPPTKVELESLPSTLRPILTREGLTKEEQSEWTDMEKFANTAGVDKAAEVGFLLYIEQRRRTRAWVVGSAVVAGALGIATGYFAWGLNRR
jgi:hypothetical protein